MNCRSLFRDITPSRFDQIHGEAFQDSEFIASMVAGSGLEPASGRWAALSLPSASVLEIGPGSGHLLAAARQAGCSVAAVETSAVHRDFIRATWGITELYPHVNEVPAGQHFDVIVAINTVEHIYDMRGFLLATRKMLAPGGTFLLSTVNALSAEVALLRTRWSMCKVHDHVSFPSPGGISVAAQAAGFQVEQVWSSELPFEFLVSVLVSGRDRLRERRSRATADRGEQAGSMPTGTASIGTAPARTSVKAGLARFYELATPLDPVSPLLAALGRAATVKARLRA